MAYTKEVKSAAMADLAAGMPVMQVSELHNVNYKTVFRWAQELPMAIRQSESYENKKERIGELIIDLLETNLIVAKTIITTVANDEEWIKRQSAGEIGILYGIITDKTATIASILTAAAQPQLPAPEQREIDPYSDGRVSGGIITDTD
jgi:hypothetical protein